MYYTVIYVIRVKNSVQSVLLNDHHTSSSYSRITDRREGMEVCVCMCVRTQVSDSEFDLFAKSCRGLKEQKIETKMTDDDDENDWGNFVYIAFGSKRSKQIG